jgi:hypothetical protein
MTTHTAATTTTTTASVTPTPMPAAGALEVPELARRFAGVAAAEAVAVNENAEVIEIVAEDDAPDEEEADGGGEMLDVSELELDREVDDVLLAACAL